jgi:polyhydroxybutyrate depolymerase
VVAYPDGLAKSWNAGSCCGDAQSRNVDDVAFISQLIDRLVKDARIDPKRVFVTGMSNGAMMAQRLACEVTDRITAIASVSGALAIGACHPTRPISILEMHGTDDPVMRFDEQLISGMVQWASLDGCVPTPKITDDGAIKTTTWTTCLEGVTVELQAVAGAVHTWFGSEFPREPDATSVVWDFFARVPSRA